VGTAVIWRWLLVAVVILCACAPQRQPLSSAAATPTATATLLTPQPLRYGLGASLRPLRLDAQSIQQIALVDMLTTDDANGYDIVVSLLPQPGFTPSQQPIALGVVINRQIPPLLDETVYTHIQAIASSLALPGITSSSEADAQHAAQQARAAWLAMGAPDGIELVLAYETELFLTEIQAHFAKANVELTLLPMAPQQRAASAQRGQAHLYLTLFANVDVVGRWRMLLPEAEVVAVGDVWLYHKLAEGISVSGYSSEGLPLIERQ
jgi:hypothetical protein